MMTDNKLITSLEGTGDVIGAFSVFCVKRNGYLLLALPRDKQAARATLKLYHPQSFLARVMAKLLSCLITFSLHIFLPCRVICIREKSSLVSMLVHAEKIGFLLGNAKANARRAVVLHECDDGYRVDKIGVGEVAKRSVVSELEIIKKLPNDHAGIPHVLASSEDVEWASYSTRYLEGRSPEEKDRLLVIGLLEDWLDRASEFPLCQTQCWHQLREFALASQDKNVQASWESLTKVSDLVVKAGLFHGDFAPWNIKVSSGDEIHVMDWEHACLSAPAGWDWLHYMVQCGLLVDHESADVVMDRCRSWARSEEGKLFLTKAGWGDHIEEWIQSYWMYSGWIAGYDRPWEASAMLSK